MLRRFMLGAVVLAAACGGSSNNKTDAAGSGSGSGSDQDTVKTVACSGATLAATVTDSGDGFGGSYACAPAGSASNNCEISVNGIVEFNLSANGALDHPVGPDPSSGMTDSGLVAPDDKITCLQFTAAGDYHYQCTVHGFKGTVTVAQ
jgi:plastocyanin